MKNENKQDNVPRTKEMQETINHLILGITMWISTSVTCLTTLLSVHQPWCLIALILPFIYTMFPQIQKFTVAVRETAYTKYKNHKEEKLEAKQQAEQEAEQKAKQERKDAKAAKKESKVPVTLEAIETTEEENENVTAV